MVGVFAEPHSWNDIRIDGGSFVPGLIQLHRKEPRRRPRPAPATPSASSTGGTTAGSSAASSSTAGLTALTSWLNQPYLSGTGTELAQVSAEYAGLGRAAHAEQLGPGN